MDANAKRIQPMLLYSFRKVLRPFVRMLHRAGVPYDEAARALAGVYLECAVSGQETGLSGPVQVALVRQETGLSEKLLADLVDNRDWARAPDRSLIPLLSEVLSRWHSDLRFLGPFGVTNDLLFSSDRESSFTELVREVNASADPVLVMEELIASGAVVRVGPQRLKVVARTLLVGGSMSSAMVEHFGDSITRLASTLEFNTFQRASRRVERAVFSDEPLTETQAKEFESLAREKVARLISELDEWLSRISSLSPDPDGRVVGQVGLGIFQYQTPAATEEQLETLLDRTRAGLAQAGGPKG